MGTEESIQSMNSMYMFALVSLLMLLRLYLTKHERMRLRVPLLGTLNQAPTSNVFWAKMTVSQIVQLHKETTLA